MRTVCTLVMMAVTVTTSSAVFAAEATERTTMPDFCSQRDVNCVIPDGPIPRIIAPPGSVEQQPVSTTQTNPGTAGITQRGARAGTTTTMVDSSGVKTVFTPAVGSAITPSGAPTSSTASGRAAAGANGTNTGATSSSTGATAGASAGFTRGGGASAATGTAAAGGGLGRR